MSSKFRRPRLILLTALVLAACATDNNNTANQLPTAPSVGTVNSRSCTSALENSKSLNGFEFLQRASSCFRDENNFGGTLLLIQGQTRSVVDLIILPAIDDEANRTKSSDLYSTLYFQAGGLGDIEIARNPVLTEKLIVQFQEWNPTYSDAYDPGWHVTERPTISAYQTLLAEQQADQLARIRKYAKLMKIDEYYLAKKEINELLSRHPEGFRSGTNDSLRIKELDQIMRNISREVEERDP